MTNLYILIGIPASGKTTWVNNHCSYVEFSDGLAADAHISRDNIRAQLLSKKYGSISSLSLDEYFSMEQKVYVKFVKAIANAIKNEQENVYVDATNINKPSRNKLYKFLQRESVDFSNVRCIAVCFSCPKELAIERDKKRTGFAHVGGKAISNFDCDTFFPFYDMQGNSNELFQWDEILVVTQKNNA